MKGLYLELLEKDRLYSARAVCHTLSTRTQTSHTQMTYIRDIQNPWDSGRRHRCFLNKCTDQTDMFIPWCRMKMMTSMKRCIYMCFVYVEIRCITPCQHGCQNCFSGAAVAAVAVGAMSHPRRCATKAHRICVEIRQKWYGFRKGYGMNMVWTWCHIDILKFWRFLIYHAHDFAKTYPRMHFTFLEWIPKVTWMLASNNKRTYICMYIRMYIRTW